MIVASGLTKTYGAKTAVDGISFTVEPGRVTGFLGPNGAGKSTTMRMILGLDRPTGGSVTVDGRRYADSPAPLREVGALLEAKAVHPGRSARNHLRWLAAATASRAPGRRGARPRRPPRSPGSGRQVLARHGPAARYRRRAARRPAGLVLDEPVNGLDPEGIRWVRNLPAGCRRGPYGLRLQPPDGRDGADRRPPDGHRPRPGAGRLLDGGLHRRPRRLLRPGAQPAARGGHRRPAAARPGRDRARRRGAPRAGARRRRHR